LRAFNISIDLGEIEITKPKKREFGHFSSNIALTLSQRLGATPIELAEKLVNEISKNDFIEDIKVMGPGFINFYLDEGQYFKEIVCQISEGYIKNKTKDLGLKGYLDDNKLKEIQYVHYRIGNILRILEEEGISIDDEVDFSSIKDEIIKEILEKLFELEDLISETNNNPKNIIKYLWELCELFYKLDSSILIRKLPKGNLRALLRVLYCVKIVIGEMLEMR